MEHYSDSIKRMREGLERKMMNNRLGGFIDGLERVNQSLRGRAAEPQQGPLHGPETFTHCQRCGRPLKSEKSRAQGMGESCKRKQRQAEEEEEQRLKLLFNIE